MDSGSFFQESILSNFVVTDQIFSYLTRSELINCSVVAKKWVPSTHQYLRRHYSCLLNLDLNEPRKLDMALEMLEKSVEIMYNGIYLDLISWLPRPPLKGIQDAFEALEPILKKIFGKILIRAVISKCGGGHALNWHALQLLGHCLRVIPVEHVEKLKIEGKLGDTWSYQLGLDDDRTLPALKELDIELPNFNGLAEFLEKCPILRQWPQVVKPLELAYFVEAKKEYLVQSLDTGKSIKPEFLRSIEMAELSLRRLWVRLDPNPELVQLIWNLLRSSTESLEEVYLCFGFFWSFIKWGLATPLKNVKKLVVGTRDYVAGYIDEDSQWDEEEVVKEKILRDVKRMEIFPNATVIKYTSMEDYYKCSKNSDTSDDENF